MNGFNLIKAHGIRQISVTITINGPISITENNLVSNLDYEDNFEVSFEYKASTLPGAGWHEVLIGNVVILDYRAQHSVL